MKSQFNHSFVLNFPPTVNFYFKLSTGNNISNIISNDDSFNIIISMKSTQNLIRA